jgi:hypothetical protein
LVEIMNPIVEDISFDESRSFSETIDNVRLIVVQTILHTQDKAKLSKRKRERVFSYFSLPNLT